METEPLLGSWGIGTDVLFPEAQLEVCPWSTLPLDLTQKERKHFWHSYSGMHTAEPEALIDSPTKTAHNREQVGASTKDTGTLLSEVRMDIR